MAMITSTSDEKPIQSIKFKSNNLNYSWQAIAASRLIGIFFNWYKNTLRWWWWWCFDRLQKKESPKQTDRDNQIKNDSASNAIPDPVWIKLQPIEHYKRSIRLYRFIIAVRFLATKNYNMIFCRYELWTFAQNGTTRKPTVSFLNKSKSNAKMQNRKKNVDLNQ